MGHQTKKNVGVTLHSKAVEFRVWAPFAKNVKLLMPYLDVFDGSNLHDMLNEGDGYWSVVLKNAEPGQNYRFQIDTGKELILRNDPRGRIVTASENGVSVISSPEFDWGDDFLMPIPHEKQIIYELHVGTFNRRDPGTQGTFYDAIEQLDYLQDLGINMIEVMPVTSMAFSNGWGYNVADVFSIENAYGGRHGLMEFVKACHVRGIGVIVDVVYNHFLSSTLWQYDGWYENERGGIYFYNDQRGDTPWGSRPDYGRPEVRQFLLDNIVMWFNEFRVDGLRLDSTAYMRNTEGKNDDPAHDIPEAWSLMQEITSLAHKIRPGAIIIAEDTSNNDYITKPQHFGGCGFDAQWALNFPHAIRQLLGLEVPWPTDLATEITTRHNDNAFNRVVFSDSHDTAANGSTRITEAVTPKQPGSLLTRQRLLIADAITLTSPGVPMLLQGQEFLQEGAFNDWQELQWDNTIKYSGIVEAHKHLIGLRKNTHGNTAGLCGQSVAILQDDKNNNVLAYHRWDQGGPKDDVVIIVNFNNMEHTAYNVRFPRSGIWRMRFNSSWQGYSSDFKEVPIHEVITNESGDVQLALPKYGVYILSQD